MHAEKTWTEDSLIPNQQNVKFPIGQRRKPL